MAVSRKLASIFYEIRANTESLPKDLKGVESQFGKLSAFVKANPVAAMVSLGTAIAGIAVQAARMASQVETSLRRVANTIPSGLQGLDTLRAGIRSVSDATGRAQLDIARDLKEIADAGVEGPEQAIERLKAVQTAVDATGAEFSNVVQGLDQTLDLFGGSSADAARALGTLFAAAQGRTSLTDLFASMERAAPTINRLKLDLDTAARALTALGERGLNARQAAAELARLGDAGAAGRAQIQELADSIQPVVDGFGQMKRAADEFNESLEQQNARALNDFKNILIDIGRAILPKVNEQLRDARAIIETLTGARSRRIADLGLTDLGAKFAEASRRNTEVLELQAGSFVRAAQRLNQTLQDGGLEIVATTTEGAEAVAAGIEHLTRVGVLRADEVEGTLARLKSLIADARNAGGPLVAGGGGPSADELKKQGEAAKKAKAEIEALGDRLAKLGTVQQISTGETRLTAAAYADLAADIVKARAEFPQFTDDLNAMSKRLVELRQAAVAFEGAELAGEIERLLASFTTTAVDDLQIALRELRKELTRRGATEAQIKQITDLEESFIAAKKSSEDLEAALSSGRQGAISPLREMVDLLNRQAEAEARLAALKDQGAEHDRERVELLGQLEQIQGRISELQGEAAESSKKATVEVNRGLSDTVDNLLHGAKAALQLADAMGLVHHETALALQNVIDLGVGIAKVIATRGKQGIPESLGAAISLASQAFGESPADKQRQKELEENTRALQKLTERVGDITGLDVTGQDFGLIGAGIGSLIKATGTAGGFRRFGDDGPLRNLDPKEFLERLGIDFADVEKVAERFGIVLNGTKQSYLDLLEAMQTADFELFVDSFAGQMDRLNAGFEIHGITDPIDQLVARAELLSKVSPAFAEIFEGLDLRTLDGRTEAAKRLREQWDRFMENPDEFRKALLASGLTLDEWKQQMLEVNDTLTEAALAAALFSEAIDDAFTDLEIAGIDDPRARADAAVGAAIAADPRFQGLAGFDLGTAEGRKAAEEFLKGLSIGADDEFKEIILQLLRAIRAIPGGEDAKAPGEVEIVGRAAQGLLETTGQDLAALARTEIVLEREQLAELRAIRDRLSPLINAPPVPLVQPPAFSQSLGAGAVTNVAGGSFSIGSLVLPPVTVSPVAGESPEATATRFSQRFVEDLSAALAKHSRFVDLTQGKIVVRG